MRVFSGEKQTIFGIVGMGSDGDRLWLLALFYGGDSRFKLVVNSALHNTAPSILAGEIKMQETGQTFHNSILSEPLISELFLGWFSFDVSQISS